MVQRIYFIIFIFNFSLEFFLFNTCVLVFIYVCMYVCTYFAYFSAQFTVRALEYPVTKKNQKNREKESNELVYTQLQQKAINISKQQTHNAIP